MGFVSCLVGHICFLFLVNTPYKLFRPVNADLARLMVFLVIAGVSVSFLARLNQAAVILLLDGKVYLAAFTPAQLQALAFFFLDLLQHGEMMAALFWALWLLPLGLLVVKSGFIPRILGIMLIGACITYVADFIISFLLWLLIVGVKKPKIIGGIS